MDNILPPDVNSALGNHAIDLLKKFLGSGVGEASEIVGDRIRFFRFKQQVKLLGRAHQILADAGLKPRAVNMKVLLPLLDAAALEDDERMVERWASLLASAADPNNPTALEASFMEILKQLAPTHARLLEVFYEQIEQQRIAPTEWDERGVVFSVLRDFLRKEVPEFDVAVDNILRLHLLKHPTVRLGVANGNDVRIQVTSSDIICGTHLGRAFVTACGRGRSTLASMSYGVPGNSIDNVYQTKGGSLRLLSPGEELVYGKAKLTD